MSEQLGQFQTLPRLEIGHTPTPIEAMSRLSTHIGDVNLWVKRDDCTGLAFGGNKVRQLEFYLGEAMAQGADTVLITGAVQSNFVRLTAAAAARLGLQCHVQLEERVPNVDQTYQNSGNVLLDKILGATLHYYDQGEDEAGADRHLNELAHSLREQGRIPYVIPLAPGHPPLGALGYVVAAQEIVAQAQRLDTVFNEIVVASGSGHTHAGLLFGLRALGNKTRVSGICVRRNAGAQHSRIGEHCSAIASLLEMDSPVTGADIHVQDDFLAPGYGRVNTATMDAMKLSAQLEGLLLDPTYTAKAMAGFLSRAAHYAEHTPGSKLLFIHTGGQPALFAYEAELTEYLQ
jgi:D-cysteine desulfhydrase/L-cysteate sulfo-lyase